MPHVPSFLVGSLVAGSGFLLVHRELSHRSRLTYRWVLAEKVEEQYRELRRSTMAEAKELIVGGEKKAAAAVPTTTDFTKTATSMWNGGVSAVRNALGRED
eukprot:CAMPEP_0197455572 /NCGR_PEP_ID=MMETSP1175-20131217/41111_1 /TAXON_ID=1003142 /ORGANISM="Triceratium dubium, Strain CCMP147" /LENGTH=100 /DNA_ID=CAMNT_0042989455 /DNA_START=46 /DNA_END=348 /DNA_ORIENTATION=-